LSKRRLKEAGVKTLPGRGEFRDPQGNRVQIVEYANIQFTKHKAVLEAMVCIRTLTNLPQRSRSFPGKESRSRKTGNR